MVRLCDSRDFDAIWTIINDGAQAYRGIIPADRWSDPYMSREELHDQIETGVAFWAYEENGRLVGVMGLQRVREVMLIRHAYVVTTSQKQGIGAQLLWHLVDLITTPLLVGTWADATWAIRFYQRHGFELVNPEEKDSLLRRYWSVPDRQVESSVVLADRRWRQRNP